MPPELPQSSRLSRRRLIKGAASITASSLLSGCSSSKNAVIPTPQSQTINFAQISSPVLAGIPSITLTASATSGLPVSFDVASGPATISGSTLTFTGVGLVSILAYQYGNATYNAAPSFLQSITIVNPNPQPVPSTVIPATVLVAATTTGAIGTGFAGLSYEKYQICYQTFSVSNANMMALFQLLGTSVLRIGGGSADEEIWTPNVPGKIQGQIAPSDVDALAGFLKATGWQCRYAINLGGDTGTQGPNGTGSPTYPPAAHWQHKRSPMSSNRSALLCSASRSAMSRTTTTAHTTTALPVGLQTT